MREMHVQIENFSGQDSDIYISKKELSFISTSWLYMYKPRRLYSRKYGTLYSVFVFLSNHLMPRYCR